MSKDTIKSIFATFIILGAVMFFYYMIKEDMKKDKEMDKRKALIDKQNEALIEIADKHIKVKEL